MKKMIWIANIIKDRMKDGGRYPDTAITVAPDFEHAVNNIKTKQWAEALWLKSKSKVLIRKLVPLMEATPERIAELENNIEVSRMLCEERKLFKKGEAKVVKRRRRRKSASV